MSNTINQPQTHQTTPSAREIEELRRQIAWQGDRILDLLDAANTSVTAVLKASLWPAAFAVLERCLANLRKETDTYELNLLDLLDNLSEPETQRVICATLEQIRIEDEENDKLNKALPA